jgi:hypothetical protein
MARAKKGSKQPDQSSELAELAEEAVKVFRDENAEAYEELVEVFNGKSADLALLGHGKFHVALEKGDLHIEPGVVRGASSTGRGAVAPETLTAILEGELTPLQAYFKGDMIARASSPDLHLAYDYFVLFSDAALRSKKLQELLVRFREITGA